MPNKENPPTAPEPGDIAKSLSQIAERSQNLVNDYLERQREGKIAPMTDDLGLARAFTDLAMSLMSNPWKLAEAQMQLWQDYWKLWQNGMQRMLGEQPAPVAEPAASDNRFKNETWQNNFVFDYIKQSYLIAAQSVQKLVGNAEGLDPQTERKVRFFTRQFVDALAPTNFAFTNPEVLAATLQSGGRNLVDGLQNLLGDLERGGGGQLAISMTDYKAFKLGENVATAPGKVVYQNDLMQLLQYTPTTEQVFRTPLLIIPPWINKYYILDLREKNSFIRWAVAQGHTVFVISWVNPDERFAGKTFEDYMREGPLLALDAIEKATGERAANVIGYCLGGTLLACTLAWLAAKGEERVRGATFFTAMIDFTEPGELGVFVDETALGNLEKKMQERGYLEGSEMASTFNLLRANDLIWSFVVNNYLLGKDPFPFDLLYWNSDATRMPAKMHTFYLRNMYIKNLLAKPGGITLGGESIDVSKVKTPVCFVSTMEDHIAPWKSTYMGAQLLAGPVRFILGGSGHIAGIVNPPAANKYQYWTSDKLAATADEWLASAQRNAGSWWPAWNEWMSQFGGEKVPARIPGEGKLNAIEDAPGSYAKLRLDQQSENPASSPAQASASAAMVAKTGDQPPVIQPVPRRPSGTTPAVPQSSKKPRKRKTRSQS